MEKTIILGVDPGINTTGYAVLGKKGSQLQLLEGGVIRGKSKETLPLRIYEIYRNLKEIIETWSPQAMALEEVYSHYERPKTAILMGHVRGVICLSAAEKAIPVYSYSATTVKKTITGSGRASKQQMQRAIQLEFRLERLPEPPDLADALAIAICHGYHCRGLGPFPGEKF
ncbi:MAG: crossover junction endodeoxyribonuclease RuvC [Planctomycetia bacterium]|nr:crossover junction endodeoxyribonuclease RuvC [Planctomycetia bacterium]